MCFFLVLYRSHATALSYTQGVVYLVWGRVQFRSSSINLFIGYALGKTKTIPVIRYDVNLLKDLTYG